jgi:hypothetical protein
MKRTIQRSSKGKKLYVNRDKSGRFKDIQSFKRAHAADLKRKSLAEIKAFMVKFENELFYVGVSSKKLAAYKAAVIRLAK